MLWHTALREWLQPHPMELSVYIPDVPLLSQLLMTWKMVKVLGPPSRWETQTKLLAPRAVVAIWRENWQISLSLPDLPTQAAGLLTSREGTQLLTSAWASSGCWGFCGMTRWIEVLSVSLFLPLKWIKIIWKHTHTHRRWSNKYKPMIPPKLLKQDGIPFSLQAEFPSFPFVNSPVLFGNYRNKMLITNLFSLSDFQINK